MGTASLETDDGNPEFPWAATISTITLAASAIVQFGSMIIAAYYLERTTTKYSDEIEEIRDDIEVKEADDKAKHLRQCYHDVTQWTVLPTTQKIMLQTALACIVTSSYLVQLFSSYCFTYHTLTDSIGENLDGKVTNLFLPLGWVAVALFCLSIICLILFESWGKGKAVKLSSGVQISPSETQTEYSHINNTPKQSLQSNVTGLA